MGKLEFCVQVIDLNRYPENPTTLGQHLKKKEIDNNLTLKQTAKDIGIASQTLITWHKNEGKVSERYYPNIMNILGYCPVETYPQNFGQHLKLIRSHAGYSKVTMGQKIGVCSKTLTRLEDENFLCHRDVLDKILVFIREQTGIVYDGQKYKNLAPVLYRHRANRYYLIQKSL